MKVLIVDDNMAIQELLSEILSMENQIIQTASTISEAVRIADVFKPEVIFIDVSINGQKFTDFIRSIDVVDEKSKPKIYVLTKDVKDIPPDSDIAGYIKKPFKTEDVLSKIEVGGEDITQSAKSEKSSLLHRFIKKTEPPVKRADAEQEASNIKFGTSYLFIEDESAGIRQACFSLDQLGCDIFFITSGKLKAVRELVQIPQMKVMGISSSRDGSDYIDGSKLGSLTSMISDFISVHRKPAIVIDDLDELIRVNDLNSIISLIIQTINNTSHKAISLLISVRKGHLTDRDITILLHNLQEYK